MTLDEIRASTRDILTPAQVAPILGCDPQCIRVTAREAPEKLGFPVTVMGTRVRIPRLPFLRFLGEAVE